MATKLLKNARIYSPVDRGKPCCGKDQGILRIIENGAILIEDGWIKDIGEEDQVCRHLDPAREIEEFDCSKRCVIPGFVDPHTHLCFARLREDEFAQRLQGVEYLEILRRGGGILSSVAAVREATQDHLTQMTIKHGFNALSCGTTTIEIKSGYGLDLENELKMLAAIRDASSELPLDVVPTFLGAHAIPQKYRNDADRFIDKVIEEMLPAVKDQGIARQCDIFCEKAVFTIEQGRRLLSAAQKLGFGIKLHADEVNDLGGAGLAAELSALSADHLLAASSSNIEAMSRQKVVATLLPATAYFLRKPYADAVGMIEKGVSVALATDCNPGSSFTESMVFVIGLAVMQMGMSPAQALTAATLNGAYAIDMAKQVGSLQVGKQADLLILDGETPAMLAYHAGVSPVHEVYKKGVSVWQNHNLKR